MTAAGLVQVAVVSALGASVVAKVVGQRRQGVQSIAIGKAGDGLLARLEPVSMTVLFLWFGTVALHGSDWAPEWFEPRLFRSRGAVAAGAILNLGALGLQLTALRQMGRSWRIGIDPGSREALVTRGVFGVSRNPIYVALDLIAVAAFVMSGSVFFLVSGLVVIVGIHVQILREERFLASAFGEDYARYRSRVARYLGRRNPSGGATPGPLAPTR
ncbi:MAG: isoprenylcysteine carboxylmethyltransferase family protein [Myxococcales bacterium]|nr:isoprenylcysteine carboxylmethyltransferase family protein [Myxococcales bacterium]